MKSNRTVYWFEVTAAFFGGTGGPGKEQGTNKPPPTGRVWERPKGDTTCPTTPQNPCWHPSWLNKACTTRKDSELKWLAKDNPETNPITIRPETVSHVAEQFSWVPLPYCSPPGCPFPIKSFALSARVSPRTIYFQMLHKSPVSGPGRVPSSWNSFTSHINIITTAVLLIVSFSKLIFKGPVWTDNPYRMSSIVNLIL